jgi:hypothetical protein
VADTVMLCPSAAKAPETARTMAAPTRKRITYGFSVMAMVSV